MLPSELCSKALQRIKACEKFNAFITVNTEKAIQQAQAGDIRVKANTALPLDGVTVAVKDNFCTKGIATTCASKMLSSYVPPYTATVVERLEKAGAIIVGKTNMDEFAMGAGATDSWYGPSRNPWCYVSADDYHISGGSSGGSAVAVATGCSRLSLGSDTGGSVRNPAARCGIPALKPSYGVLSRYGLIPLTHSLDCPGLFGTSVEDIEVMFDVLIADGPDSMDPTNRAFPEEQKAPKEALRVGIPQEYYREGLSAATLDAWNCLASLLEERGHTVVPVQMPHTKYSLACYSILNAVEVASNMACYDSIEFGHRAGSADQSTEALYAASRHETFNQTVRRRILAGHYFLLRANRAEFYDRALRMRRLIVEEFDSVFSGGVDLLLAPVTLREAPHVREFENDCSEKAFLEDYCTQPSNIAGVPALQLPCGLGERDLPIGMQLIAPVFGERTLFQVGRWLEKELKFVNPHIYV